MIHSLVRRAAKLAPAYISGGNHFKMVKSHSRRRLAIAQQREYIAVSYKVSCGEGVKRSRTMSFEKTFSYSSYNAEIYVDIFNEFYKPYEIKELVKFKKGFFKRKSALLGAISQDKWYMCQKFYSPTTYLIKSKNTKDIELFHKQWAKIYEILEEFQLIPKSVDFDSLHLDEEYGAVIGAVNHYLHSKSKKVCVLVRYVLLHYLYTL